MDERPKYALAEIERRWTVRPADLPELEHLTYTVIHDKYLPGTRLRLRAMQGGGEAQYKLGKKYGDRREYSESITNIYLSRREYELLNRAEGREISKRRYRVSGGSLDVYAAEGRPILFSVEFADEGQAERYQPPSFVAEEVTHDEAYSGYALAKAGD